MSTKNETDFQEFKVQDEEGNVEHYIMFPAEEENDEADTVSNDEIAYSEEEIAEHFRLMRENCREREEQEHQEGNNNSGSWEISGPTRGWQTREERKEDIPFEEDNFKTLERIANLAIQENQEDQEDQEDQEESSYVSPRVREENWFQRMEDQNWMMEELSESRRWEVEVEFANNCNLRHAKRPSENPFLIGLPDYRGDMDKLKLDLYQVIESWALWRANNEKEYTFDLKGNFLN